MEATFNLSFVNGEALDEAFGCPGSDWNQDGAVGLQFNNLLYVFCTKILIFWGILFS